MRERRGYEEALERELFREEFPFGPVSRRGFLALGLLSLAACTPVVRRKGVPYVRQPEWVVEGERRSSSPPRSMPALPSRCG